MYRKTTIIAYKCPLNNSKKFYKARLWPVTPFLVNDDVLKTEYSENSLILKIHNEVKVGGWFEWSSLKSHAIFYKNEIKLSLK